MNGKRLEKILNVEKMINVSELCFLISFLYICMWAGCSYIWVVKFGYYESAVTINNFYKNIWFIVLIFEVCMMINSAFIIKKCKKDKHQLINEDC